MGKGGSGEAFRKGVELVGKGRLDEAIAVFQDGLDNAAREREKGSFHYNIAACQVRLGRDGPAIEALDKAMTAAPWLIPKVRRDKDFAVLRDAEGFHTLFERHRGRYVRTRRWYLAWFFGGGLLGFVLAAVSGERDPLDRAVQLGVMGLPAAWFIGKVAEGVHAFRRGVKGSGRRTAPRARMKAAELQESASGVNETCPGCGHSWMGNWDEGFTDRQCPQCGKTWNR